MHRAEKDLPVHLWGCEWLHLLMKKWRQTWYCEKLDICFESFFLWLMLLKSNTHLAGKKAGRETRWNTLPMSLFPFALVFARAYFRRWQQASSTQTMTVCSQSCVTHFFTSTEDHECLAWGVKFITDCTPRSSWCSRTRIKNGVSLKSQLIS